MKDHRDSAGDSRGKEGSPFSPHARINRESWNDVAAGYQEEHGPGLSGDKAMAWGIWRIPEQELRVLDEVSGRDVLELGCGGAQWSIALSRRGARCVGLDVAENQLRHARRNLEAAGLSFPLVHASAESLPFTGESFDIVFCDWGATAFTDPRRTVPEVARVLRPGGLFAFSGGTPFFYLCIPDGEEEPGDVLVRDYFGLSAIIEEGWVEFMLPYGEWIELFHRHGLQVEALLELRPPADAVSTYRDERAREWARRWPAEQIWKVRKRG